MKFHLHSATDEPQLEHGTAPSRTGNDDLHGLRTVLWMPRNQRRTFAQKLGGVEVVLGADLQYGVGQKIFKEYASLDFGLDDIPIDFVAQVGMRHEHGFPGYDSPNDCLTVSSFSPHHNMNLDCHVTLWPKTKLHVKREWQGF